MKVCALRAKFFFIEILRLGSRFEDWQISADLVLGSIKTMPNIRKKRSTKTMPIIRTKLTITQCQLSRRS